MDTKMCTHDHVRIYCAEHDHVRIYCAVHAWTYTHIKLHKNAAIFACRATAIPAIHVGPSNQPWLAACPVIVCERSSSI